MRALLAALLAATAWALAACSPPAEPAMWRIADEDSEIWLFGSVHLLPEEVKWDGPRWQAAFANAEEFVTETDTSAEASAAFPQLAAQYGTLPEGQRLSDLMNADDRARLGRAAALSGLNPAALEGLRPWLAALQLSYGYAQRAGHHSELGVEGVLARRARAEGKWLSFFETPEEQVRILADLAPADEARFLSITLRQIEEEADTMRVLDRAWARGDVATLDRALSQEWTEGGAAVHEAVILRRNRAWADEIERRLQGSGRIFIAVGAAHLIGDDSVVDLLRTRGVEVEGP
ncbi:TraB/GumN family protein [Terricaulis silvestris]|uniref:TraB family protein n=1 Tax=Terricaulis silvestris TaxID=2686094 RepID=A0A6I6MTT1_9CAUL|nr:TraB/GumN family protein [Terricaulis silvestris]QGZ96866.1 TraB family protein [Terricaulis silvestris]